MSNPTAVTKIFNGIYTVQGPKGHRTFKIETVTNEGGFFGKRIISLLIGQNNTSDYKGFGFVKETGIEVWRSKQGTSEKRSDYENYAVLLWALVVGDAKRFPSYSYQMSGHCIRCNRLLTEPNSIETGIGPVCAGRGLLKAA